jgi:TPR repeat protein
MLKRVLARLMATMVMTGAAVAGPLEDAYDAYQHADFSTALKLYRLAGPIRDARDQLALGEMYFFGEGVLEDYVEAVE